MVPATGSPIRNSPFIPPPPEPAPPPQPATGKATAAAITTLSSSRLLIVAIDVLPLLSRAMCSPRRPNLARCTSPTRRRNPISIPLGHGSDRTRGPPAAGYNRHRSQISDPRQPCSNLSSSRRLANTAGFGQRATMRISSPHDAECSAASARFRHGYRSSGGRYRLALLDQERATFPGLRYTLFAPLCTRSTPQKCDIPRRPRKGLIEPRLPSKIVRLPQSTSTRRNP